MENTNLNETIPGKKNTEKENQDTSHLEETMAFSIGQGKSDSDLGKTEPVRSQNVPEEAQLEETIPTIPYPASQEDLTEGATIPTAISQDTHDRSGFEATLPPPTHEDAESPGGGGNLPPLPSSQPSERKIGVPSMRLMVLLGVIGLALIAVLSAFGGYASGISQRSRFQATQIALSIQEQYEMGLQDMQDRNFERARQRFEFVIQQDPNYAGVTEKLAEVLLELKVTPTPTVGFTPEPTSTPDLRGAEEMLNLARGHLANGDWKTAIDTLLNLRRTEPEYQPVHVDGMLYAAYQNQGKDKILKVGDLEGGIYDLRVAERFGPLDADAKGYITWAQLYILGASFWEVDWSQAVYYFGQVAPALPNLRDGSGWTATERYRLSLIGYADDLTYRRDWCTAMQQYELALAYGMNADVQQSYKLAMQKCIGDQPPTETPKPTKQPEELPTETPEEPSG